MQTNIYFVKCCRKSKDSVEYIVGNSMLVFFGDMLISIVVKLV